MLLKDLSKGDIFQDGKNSWDGLYRFHSCSIQGDRLLVYLIGLSFSGNISLCHSNSFTWRDINHQVYIPVFYRCEFKKSKDIPCIPVNNNRIFYPSNLNSINISNKYCEGNNYWYEYADLIY